MTEKIKNYGFQKPVFKPTDHIHVLGAVDEILVPDRNWIPYLPQGEIQKRKIESYSCTEFATLNGVETLEKRKFGSATNHSERAVAIGSRNTPAGNDPSKVADWIRHNGLVTETTLPFDDSIMSIEQYLSPNPLTSNIVQEGKKWLETRDFGYKWVFTTESLEEKQKRLYEALQYSPLGVAVAAWSKNENGLYFKAFDANHWTLLIGAEWGKKWIIYDSYTDDDFIKELEWQYDFEVAQRYVLTEKQPVIYSNNWLRDLWSGIIKGRHYELKTAS